MSISPTEALIKHRIFQEQFLLVLQGFEEPSFEMEQTSPKQNFLEKKELISVEEFFQVKGERTLMTQNSQVRD
jgi:hypothetical protein